MFRLSTTKLKVFIALMIILLVLRYFNSIDLQQYSYTGQLTNDARHNITGYQSRDVLKPVDILRKIPEYMEITKLDNLQAVAYAKNSNIEIRNNKVQYHIGDTIEIYVELRDSRNEAITKGGNVLRIWMTEESLHASAGGHVIDFNNGLYLAIVKALWVGSPKITVAIGCTKKHIGIYLNFLEKHGTFFNVIGIFEKEDHPGNAETQCASIPNSKFFERNVCDFTAENYNMSFYCEKPVGYECRDWTKFRHHADTPPLDEDTAVFFRTNLYPKIQDVTVKIEEDALSRRKVSSPVKSCSDFQAAKTWNRSVPVGYMYDNKWISLQCSIDFPRTTQAYTKCLTKIPLIFIGDSTTRIFFVNVMNFLSLKLDTPEVKNMNEKSWQRPVRASSPDGEISVEWMPHEHPFASSGFRRNLRSVSARLSEIGSNRDVIILIHWYLHPARYLSPELYRLHVKNAVEAIKSLLQRSPNAKILVKGPHSHTYPHSLVPYDFVAKFMEQVIYEEFKDIHNSVYYVDYWDMTLGNQNVNAHPTDSVNSIMINNFMSFVCHN
ncbi:NXPE family member 4-like [Mizuhopecten yessoensis]|uniref:NXPE family member 4-like n=1 Tax=Mizuhopecten yessoensis TaxID=6573 RepID=UPI000B45F401|nr:NXPE family member 4-like [Mizuhopecten yessoensis]XP_021348132.1 NXPE family member 4-like [Mizuhopecten yessoensis]XP_021348133.1 NXPE family member 4-like [Mizuhopecten yessoensis]XP_021348134.1 NXPE family member 4-like [Mizuhopecten yessoensis]XP_021348135.1 NXPE family member 4-like [Mizuhopecten yessoensis]